MEEFLTTWEPAGLGMLSQSDSRDYVFNQNSTLKSVLPESTSPSISTDVLSEIRKQIRFIIC